MKTALFSYDFPHRKSQDFLLHLWLEDIPVECVIGAPAVKVSRPASILRVKPRHQGLIHPAHVCARLGTPYHVMDHNSEQTARLLRDLCIDLVIIAGARILKKPVLEIPTIGIINFHPGPIPEVRGLDALKWSVYYDVPAAVTVHFIDERVDAGRIILRKRIPIFADDSWVDVSLRLDETQVELLPVVMNRLIEDPRQDSYELVRDGTHNRSMPPEYERIVQEKFEAWKRKYARPTG